MYKKLFIILTIPLFFLFFPKLVLAKIYINEFSSYTTDNDWVELYNSDSNSVELAKYCLRDDSKTNKLQLSGSIAGQDFLVFNWNDKLNRSGDSIRLFLNCDESQPPEDQIIYGKGKDITAPGDGQAAGRTPDGGDKWSIFSEQTAGKPNTEPPVPTTTPTPTDIPTPTRTPTPTHTPTPTKAPTPTKIPTPVKSVPTPVSSNTPIPVKSTPTPATH